MAGRASKLKNQVSDVVWYSVRCHDDHPAKITLGMRESGVREVLIYYADYKCTHHITMNADRWERRPLSRLKQGFDSPRERQQTQALR